MIRVAFIIGDYPPEERRLREEVARSFSTAEVEVGILSVKPSPFGGLSPAEIQLVAPYFHAAYLQAEHEGYDAAVPLGTLDLGVDTASPVTNDYPDKHNQFNGSINWVQIDIDAAADQDHLISPDERFRIAVTRQ